MRGAPIAAALTMGTFLIATPVAIGKDGVVATVHTSLAAAAEGDQVDVRWSLEVEETGDAFTACGLFVRLTGPTGKTTEAYAGCLPDDEGRFTATATVPKGGVQDIEIGIAGTMTDREGNRRRSDWLIPLANDPMADPLAVTDDAPE